MHEFALTLPITVIRIAIVNATYNIANMNAIVGSVLVQYFNNLVYLRSYFITTFYLI